MTKRVPLHAIARARAGDKGDTSNIALFLDDPRHWEAVRAQVTPERLLAEWPRLLLGPVRRFELPRLLVFNFVLERALEGGVNASLNLDGHGKSWSFLLLGLEVELEEGEPQPSAGQEA